jgi:hypothetical protein
MPAPGILLWHIDPLLGRDLETGNEYSRCYAVGGQTNNRFYATVEVLLNYNNRNGIFYVARAEML